MTFIHPSDKRILDFAARLSQGDDNLEKICRKILIWFDDNVEYSRLNAPLFPLQRSDLDLLAMRAGTCGDYANLVVSVLSAMGFDVCYAYVHRDCYGDAQDHICAAVIRNGKEILIDATQPYRKWYGFDCPHQEYELLSPDVFEAKMKKEENYWSMLTKEHNKALLAGLLYAPWIHAECIHNSKEVFDNVFFLLSFSKQLEPTLYVYYQHYTAQESSVPVMVTIFEFKTYFCFSVYPHNGLWDNKQWSEAFKETEIPDQYLSKELDFLKSAVSKVGGQINSVLREAGCHSFI